MPLWRVGLLLGFGLEPLLLSGYQGLKQHEAEIPANGERNLTNALERLVQFYVATGHPDQAAEWKKQLGVPAPSR